MFWIGEPRRGDGVARMGLARLGASLRACPSFIFSASIRRMAILLTLLLFIPSQDDKATVYIYQTPHARMMKRAAPEVFCDEKLIAKLDGGRYFVVKLDPGVHSFRSKNKKNGGMEKEFKAGEVYYLRLTMEHTGYFLKFSGISSVQPEEGSYTVKQLRAINEKDVKDPSVVDMSVTEQAIKKQ